MTPIADDLDDKRLQIGFSLMKHVHGPKWDLTQDDLVEVYDSVDVHVCNELLERLRLEVKYSLRKP